MQYILALSILFCSAVAQPVSPTRAPTQVEHQDADRFPPSTEGLTEPPQDWYDVLNIYEIVQELQHSLTMISDAMASVDDYIKGREIELRYLHKTEIAVVSSSYFLEGVNTTECDKWSRGFEKDVEALTNQTRNCIKDEKKILNEIRAEQLANLQHLNALNETAINSMDRCNKEKKPENCVEDIYSHFKFYVSQTRSDVSKTAQKAVPAIRTIGPKTTMCHTRYMDFEGKKIFSASKSYRECVYKKKNFN